MLQGWEGFTNLELKLQVQLGLNQTRLAASLGEDASPGVDDETVAVAWRVFGALVGGENISLLFDGTGLEQHGPVGLSRFASEGSWAGESHGTSNLQLFVEGGETKVVAGAET